jgi:hypothetical protein
MKRSIGKPPTRPPCPLLPLAGLHEAIRAAGRACAADASGGAAERERGPVELFYSRPTVSTGQLLREVAAAAARAGTRPDGAAAADLEAVGQLSRGVAELLGGAAASRSEQQQQHGPALAAAVAGLDEPEWSAGGDVRAALRALADACCRCGRLWTVLRAIWGAAGGLLLAGLSSVLGPCCAPARAAGCEALQACSSL